MDGACHEGDDSHAARRIRARGLTCSHPPAHQPRRSKSLHSTDGCTTPLPHSVGLHAFTPRCFPRLNLFFFCLSLCLSLPFFFLVSVFLSNAVIIPQEVSQTERSYCKDWTSHRTFPDNEKKKEKKKATRFYKTNNDSKKDSGKMRDKKIIIYHK